MEKNKFMLVAYHLSLAQLFMEEGGHWNHSLIHHPLESNHKLVKLLIRHHASELVRLNSFWIFLLLLRLLFRDRGLLRVFGIL